MYRQVAINAGERFVVRNFLADSLPLITHCFCRQRHYTLSLQVVAPRNRCPKTLPFQETTIPKDCHFKSLSLQKTVSAGRPFQKAPPERSSSPSRRHFRAGQDNVRIALWLSNKSHATFSRFGMRKDTNANRLVSKRASSMAVTTVCCNLHLRL